MDLLYAPLVVFIALLLYPLRRRVTAGDGKGNGAQRGPPEPDGAWPLIGHLHLLAGPAPIARTLAALADTYGPIFSLRLGAFRRALVISDREAARECFTVNDRIFANRPEMAVSEHVGYKGAAFAMAPYGAYWRDLRKLATTELLSAARLHQLRYVRASVAEAYLKDLHRRCGGAGGTVAMDAWFERFTISMTLRTAVGRRFGFDSYDERSGEAARLRKALKAVLHHSGHFVPSDFLPFVKWADIGGHIASMDAAFRDFDALLSDWVEEHATARSDRRKTAAGGDSGADEGDFMDVMLSHLEDNASVSSSPALKQTIVKATAMTLLLTGTESVSLTLTWALSLLLNHPAELRRCQEEIEVRVGRGRWVEESDARSLPFLEAVIKETLRLYPPGPLSGPREAMEDCSVGGYRMRRGTRLVFNIWKLHRDPRVWVRPEEFLPERFLGESGGVGFEFLPFSSGRRSCPAVNYAWRVATLTLGRLIQGFDMAAAGGGAVDMREGVGIALPKVAPLRVVLSPRLSPELY